MTETIPIKKQTGLPPGSVHPHPIGRSSTMAKLSNAPATLLDMGNYPDVFVEGIGRIDDGGAVTHITWYVRQICAGKTNRVSALRVVVPTDMLPTIVRQLANPASADTDLADWRTVDAEDASFAVN
jgi:hypothetical protein